MFGRFLSYVHKNLTSWYNIFTGADFEDQTS
jgi:hypothetical protein